MHDENTSPKPAKAPPPAASHQRVTSAQLLRGQNTLEIEHAGQLYLLRVTRENKLILTK